MSYSHRLSDSLRRALGEDAAEDMVSWMEDLEGRADLRGDMAELRQQVRDDIAGLRQEIRGVDAALRQEIAHAKYDLIKWSFVFWVSAVMSVAALARVLR